MGVVIQLGEARDPNASLKPLLGLVADAMYSPPEGDEEKDANEG